MNLTKDHKGGGWGAGFSVRALARNRNVSFISRNNKQWLERYG